MIIDLRQHVAELAVLALFAVAGFVSVCWLAAGAAERIADWWRDRHLARRLLAADDPAPCGLCGSIEPCEHDELPLELPPERTWEQMTSHQLPLADGTRGVESAGIVREQEPWRVEAPTGPLSVRRERRPPWWEAEHRAAYESLGFDYPSGLMARVREAAQ